MPLPLGRLDGPAPALEAAGRFFEVEPEGAPRDEEAADGCEKMGATGCFVFGCAGGVGSSEQLLSRCLLMSLSGTLREHIGLCECEPTRHMTEEEH